MSDDDRLTVSDQGTGGSTPGPRPMPHDERAHLPGRGAWRAPDLIGLGFLEAHALAAASHLRLSVSVWETTVGPWGRVLDQRPEPDRHIRRGGRIIITVSGRPHEQVPDVCGFPLGDAIERVAWLGFVPLADVHRPSPAVAAGHVVATRPPAGELLASGSVVALTVARARRETTTRSAPAAQPVPAIRRAAENMLKKGGA